MMELSGMGEFVDSAVYRQLSFHRAAAKQNCDVNMRGMGLYLTYFPVLFLPVSPPKCFSFPAISS